MDRIPATAAERSRVAADDRYHYGVVARAIGILDAAGGAPVPLDRLAAELGLSSAHFQRVFSRWAGVSPKRYQQYLTLDHAKSLLARRVPLAEAADAAGLSGPSRLHDLFIRWEAMAPGAYAMRGAGLTLRWGALDTVFGPAIAMASDRGLCGLAFTAETGEAAALADLAARWPAATVIHGPAEPVALAEAALAGSDSRLHVMGAPFQIKVWEALLAVPEGRVTTYGDIAAAIGQDRAVRAVGTAIGRNPISAIIPCHRALRKSGGLGGYHWGLPVKRAMLAREAARADAGNRSSAGA